ncbi:rcc01693 family protein [Rhizobium helianthi]|uniref:Rcc01693 family protein n=1 Tax=Rhizobium helianthi TaxID=1132695 RepID=A0ABW4M591_9HYPH
MHMGLCVLRLSPETFWRLSPREFMAMAGGCRPRRDAMDRAEMEALMRLFPDEAERS